jgi:hypothetical protein
MIFQSHTMGIIPQTKQNPNLVHIEIGFQQQILNYEKLVTFNKYLTKKMNNQ